jgi:hypothetical protein
LKQRKEIKKNSRTSAAADLAAFFFVDFILSLSKDSFRQAKERKGMEWKSVLNYSYNHKSRRASYLPRNINSNSNKSHPTDNFPVLY